MKKVTLVPTIGLEVHAELDTKSKLFCGCPVTFGAPPNSCTCPVCTGMPGSLPVMNREAFRKALVAALAFNCKVERVTYFDRKNYYYPDLPKNYQISQNYANLGTDGFVEIEVNGRTARVGILNVHLEEDAGKSLHPEDTKEDVTLIDLNRAGVPLLEIVSAPDMHTIEEVTAYMQAVRGILLYSGVSQCRMERGQLRFEASISMAPEGACKLGPRVEIKNLNSMKAVEGALRFEMDRQKRILEEGGTVERETLLWDEAAQRCEPMRSKETSQDYRYFPEPDLVPVVIDEKMLKEAEAAVPELPLQKKIRFIREYGLPEYDATVLTQSPEVASFFEETVRACGLPKKASNWVMTSVLSVMNETGRDIEEIKRTLTPDRLGALIRMVEDGKLNNTAAKRVFSIVLEKGESPEEAAEREHLLQMNDEDELRRIVKEVVHNNPSAVEDIRKGKKQAVGFLVGQVMRATRGRANASRVQEMISEEIG